VNEYITYVVEYKKDDVQPEIKANMPCLGGRVVRVMFDDAIRELDKIENGE
jgi:hypothetical protein